MKRTVSAAINLPTASLTFAISAFITASSQSLSKLPFPGIESQICAGEEIGLHVAVVVVVAAIVVVSIVVVVYHHMATR